MSKFENSGNKNRPGPRPSSVEKAAARLAEAAAQNERETTKPDGGETHGTQGGSPVHVPRRTSRELTLDHTRIRASGIVSSEDDHSLIAEEFRLVKRPLLLNAAKRGDKAIRNGNLIMVTSARPNEGKTFCAINLAMSIASEPDLTVLLVDADVSKPSIPAVMGFESELGLVDVLDDESLDLSDVMLRTDYRNLSVLPAGRQHNLSTELLASERMERMVEEIAQRYSDRIVIIDSPPVLMSSVASVMALHVGQILFVVEAEGTSQDAIDSSLTMVNACPNISLLLNKARTVGVERFGAYPGYYGSYVRESA